MSELPRQWPPCLCAHHLGDGEDALRAALTPEPNRVTRVMFAGKVIGGYVPENPVDDQIELHVIPTALPQWPEGYA